MDLSVPLFKFKTIINIEDNNTLWIIYDSSNVMQRYKRALLNEYVDRNVDVTRYLT